jgi:CHASE1-domain containing sensor protein
MFFNILYQQTTPDTVGMMLLGYGLIALVTVLYIATLIIRRRNLMRDLAVLEDLDE